MSSRRRVTLADVAQHAGVSHTTASFVTSGREDMRISAAAARRVLDAAAELGYRPNLTARSLRTTVTHTYGILADSIASDPCAGEMISGALEAGHRHGRLLFLAETGGDPALEERFFREMTDRQVDGLLYARKVAGEVRPPGSRGSTPLVLLNCLPVRDSAAAVIPDEINAGRTAAMVILEAGHRDRIHLVGDGGTDLFAYRERTAGISEVMAAASVRLAAPAPCPWWPAPAYRAVSRLLSGCYPPRALICLDDRIALGAYQALQAAGLAVPTDVSVVSFGGSTTLASLLQPPLTTVALPYHDVGYKAVELLAAGQLQPATHRLLTRLHLGGSVAAPVPQVASSAVR
jgi:LacI family transcriptional regulator